MRAASVLVSAVCALSACAPDFWCAEARVESNPAQRRALAAYERAARDWRDAIRSGSPPAEDRGRVEALRAAAADYLAAEETDAAGARLELLRWTRRFLFESREAFPDPRERRAAARRAADAARRWAPETAPYLP